MRGTVLNTATVALGATVGYFIGHALPETYKEVALHGLGLVTVGMGIKMFLQARNPLIAALAIAAGGVLGLALGLQTGLEHIATWTRDQLGQSGSDTFVKGLVTTFVLFCIGPMTLLGCMQDAIEKKIELLSLKSTMDGIAAIFFAAAMGAGVIVTSVLLFIFQGLLTLFARFLKPMADDAEALAELSATGGAILVGTGLGLLEIKELNTANYLPSIFIAPALVLISRRIPRRAK